MWDNLQSRSNFRSRQFEFLLISDFITDFALCLYGLQKNTVLRIFSILLLISNMPTKINIHFRGAHEITNNSNSLVVHRIWKPLRAGFLHHINMIQLLFTMVGVKGSQKLPEWAAKTPSFKNQQLVPKLHHCFLCLPSSSEGDEREGEKHLIFRSLTVLLWWSLATIKPMGAVANRPTFKHSSSCSESLSVPCGVPELAK